MSVEAFLRCTSTSNMEDIVAEIKCSPSCFNMRSVLVTIESLWRLSGCGTSSIDKYLDDQVKYDTSNSLRLIITVIIGH